MMNHKLISVFFSIILFSSFLTLLPIVPVYSEPLTPVTGDFSKIIVLPNSVNYYTSYSIAQMNFSLSQQSVNITYHNSWFSLSKPDFGVTGVTYQLLSNSSMIVMKWSKANYYFAMGFDIQNIDHAVKFGVQWSLDQPRDVVFHVAGNINYQTASKFVFGNRSTGEDSLAFDWSDIRNVNFQINKSLKTVTVSLPQSGYIDPSISLNAGVYWGQQYADTSTTFALSNSSRRAAYSFTALWSKTVTQIQLRSVDVTGTAPIYTVGIQADSSGSPSGTYLGSGPMTHPTTASYTVTLTSSVALTAGTVYWVVIQYSSGTINTSNYWSASGPSFSNHEGSYTRPYDLSIDLRFAMKTRLGSTWLGQTPCGNGWEIITSDGFVDGVPYYDQSSLDSFTHTAFPAEIFTVNQNMNVSSVEFMKVGTAGNQNTYFFGLLYNVTGGTLLQNVSLTNPVSTWYGWLNFKFSSTILLKTGRVYRVAIQSGTAATGTTFRYMAGSSTNVTLIKANWMNSANTYQSTANGGSTFTNSTSYDLEFRFSLVNIPLTTTTTTVTTTSTTTSTTTITNTVTETVTTTTTLSTFTTTITTTLSTFTTTLTETVTTTLSTYTTTVTTTLSTYTTTVTNTTTLHVTETITNTVTSTITSTVTSTLTLTSTITQTNTTTVTNCTATGGGNLALAGTGIFLFIFIAGFLIILILVSKKR